MKKISIILLLGFIGLFGTIRCDNQKQVRQNKTINNTRTVKNDDLRNGDIIFQASKSSQSKAIQLATNSQYSHMGIVYETNGEFYVYEAIQPVKLTKLNDWIKRGENSHYVVKRLKDSEKLLTKENIRKLKDYGEKFKSKSYCCKLPYFSTIQK